ncbi:transcriptional regulator [Azospirillum sp. A39]|uniref:transcriptional regulator n=1 Tax=Azospirillum sp. A39 TaxID=3462279 RepID=UPI004045FADC
MSAAVDRVRGAWRPPPAWVLRLAEEVDASSLAQAGARIGFSKATVSLVLANRYGADVARVQAAVIKAFAPAVDCPVLGPIDPARCRRERSAPFRPSVPLAALLRAACRTCALRDGGET